MYLLDTNVVSELRRTKPHSAVVAWVRSAADRELHIGAPTIGEIQNGVERVRPLDAQKAAEIETWLDIIVRDYTILPMDADAFRLHAKLMAGRTDDVYEDAMIAAIANLHGLTVATRNVRDFVPFGVKTLNPFK
jgi:toxin FitB